MKASRLQWIITVLMLLPFLSYSSVRAEDQLRGKDFSSLYTDRINASVQNGLDWLARHQLDNGAWKSIVGYKLNDQVEMTGDKPYPHVGVTGIAGLAFLSAGYFPGRGQYGEVVEGAVEFILSKTDPETGYISYKGTRMYEHGFATLFLAEVYGMTGDPDVREALKRAVRCIRYSQNKHGGWRYQARPKDADLSVTVTILQSLRAANNVGVTVEKSIIDGAMQYVKDCYKNGAFMYQANRMSRRSWALTAAGVVSLHSAGEYDSTMVNKGIRTLKHQVRRNRRMRWGNYHYFYGHYYASQALYQSGWDNFQSYYKRFARQVLREQKPDGRWEDDVSPTYATSMACLILQLPIRYLPIFQK